MTACIDTARAPLFRSVQKSPGAAAPLHRALHLPRWIGSTCAQPLYADKARRELRCRSADEWMTERGRSHSVEWAAGMGRSEVVGTRHG